MDTTHNIKVGQVVRAKSGRDTGEFFVVLEILSDSYVFIVNGKRRTLNKPKKKKIKHLSILKDIIDLEVLNLNDAYISKMLKTYSNQGG